MIVLPMHAGLLLASLCVVFGAGIVRGMLAGIWLGQRVFVGVSPEALRRLVPSLLMLIAGLGVLRALWTLWA